MRPAKLVAAPGPRPACVNAAGAFISSKSDEEARERDRIDMEWEQQVLMYSFQQMKIDKAVEREEKRQSHIQTYGLDPVSCTRALLMKRSRA